MAGDLAGLVSRLEAVTTRLEKVASKGGAGGASGADDVDTEIVDLFDSEVVCKKLKEYVDLSNELGGEIAEHSKLVQGCFNYERAILLLACKHRQPKPDVLSKTVKPLSEKVNEVVTFAEKRRGSKFVNHLNTVKEGIGCVGWVTVSPKPAPYVKEAFNQSLFYGNRVLKEYKGKEDKHVTWMRAYTGAIQELQKYVENYHKTGLTWNPSGSELTAAPAPPSAGGPPPPPPPVAAPPPPPVAAPSGGGGDDTAALKANLFASLNKGSDITKGLKKVTNDMKTHKNPELRASSVVKASDTTKKPAAAAAKKTAAPAVKKPPVCELQGQKWIVEYQEDNNNLEITPTDPKQLVYMYRCSRCTLKVNGKLNCVSVDSCKRVGVVIDDVISCVESINCQSVKIQVLGACPTVSIDKTDGCQVFLSKKSISAEIVTAKSSEMNICIPDGDEFVERAIPEQFKTTWDGKKLVTVCTDINA